MHSLRQIAAPTPLNQSISPRENTKLTLDSARLAGSPLRFKSIVTVEASFFPAEGIKLKSAINKNEENGDD